MTLLTGLLSLILFCSTSYAQTQGGVGQWRDWISQARSTYTPLADKEKVAQKVLENLRQDMGKEYKVEDQKKFYESVVSDPEKLKTLTTRNGKYQDLFTEFSSLVAQISVERKLKNCEDYQQMKQGMMEGASSYDPCAEGIYSHSYIIWESKKQGEIKATEYSIPNFLYSENLQDILAVSNNYHSSYGSLSDPPLQLNSETIRKSHPAMKSEEVLKLYGMMRLQNDAYQRSILNASRNALSLEYQYGSKGWTDSEMREKVISTLDSTCKHCSAKSKGELKLSLYKILKKDIAASKITPKDPQVVAQQMCQRLQEERYPFVHNLGVRDLSPLSLTMGMGKVKLQAMANERLKILSKLAQSGGDGLLLLTDSLTDMDEKRPASLKMSCRQNDLASDSKLVQAAGAEAKANALEYVQKINDDFNMGRDFGDVRENLKMLMRTNPRSIGEALDQNPKMASYSCQLIGEIKGNDEDEKFKDNLVIWGSAVVGGALTLTGVLAPAGAAITMGALALGTTVGIGTGIYEYANSQDALEKSELYESAMFASGDTRLLAITQTEYEHYQSAKLSAMMNFGFSAVDVLATVKNLVKSGKTLKEASDLVADGSVDVSTAARTLDVVEAPAKVTTKLAGQTEKFTITNIDDQIDYLVKEIPGLEKVQARYLLEAAHSRNSSVVFGGSRIRGNYTPTSDLDVGFGQLTGTQAGKILKKAHSIEGGLPIEQTKIVPGNSTPTIKTIISPEEFFQRRGIRGGGDLKAGQEYLPSGSITVNPDGSILRIYP
jgi:hypothetical protein